MHKSLEAALLDLESQKDLIRIDTEVDPYLELPAMQQLAYERGLPALLFENVKGTPFRVAANVYATKKRARYLFRGTMDLVKEAIRIKADPGGFVKKVPGLVFKNPGLLLKLALSGVRSLPRKTSWSRSAVAQNKTSLASLPQVQCWPKDGGAFVLLPQVASVAPGSLSSLSGLLKHSNLGMYRVQISGNDYKEDEVGLHYQIHRSIGVHHASYLQQGQQFDASIFVGGPPAHALAAVIPNPEGLSELILAGMLSGRRFRYHKHHELEALMSADADFNLVGTVAKGLKPEGPFGDHLGYYSHEHPFPYLENVQVYHREKAIWPITVVGRPPQEDSVFGSIIHELTESMVPVSIPGVKALHAVDEAGVHPLLLAIGSERYRPNTQDTNEIGPQEILTQSFAILGFNQASLAKYLCIMDEKTYDPQNISDTQNYLQSLLERIDFSRDLHFHTKATMDTLDYSGGGLHRGSKLVLAATGKPKRRLSFYEQGLPELGKSSKLVRASKGVSKGIIAVDIGAYTTKEAEQKKIAGVIASWNDLSPSHLEETALIVLTDETDFLARSYKNFLWATFTRSNPASDVYGVHAFTEDKHWGCRGPLIIDGRHKPWIPAELSHPKEVVASATKKLAPWL